MDLLGPILMSAACIAYNNTVNTWPRFQSGGLYVALNLAVTAAATGVGFAVVNLSLDKVGLRGDLRDVWLGTLIALAVTVPIFLVALSRHPGRVADRRVAALRGPELAYQALVRIPLGTALTEEILFRGVLFASWRAAGSSTITATLVSALVFGLWHIAPMLNLVHANRPQATIRTATLLVVAAVAFTTAAGVALTWLRLETQGLAAPIAFHAGTNSLATIASVIAARRSAAVGR